VELHCGPIAINFPEELKKKKSHKAKRTMINKKKLNTTSTIILI